MKTVTWLVLDGLGWLFATEEGQVHDDFSYMKFIYLHCGEEMKLRDPRS